MLFTEIARTWAVQRDSVNTAIIHSYSTGTPSQQEERVRQRESTRLNIRAQVEEAYAALKALVEEEERSRSQANAEETGLPYEMAENRYHDTTGGGAEQETLSTCGNKTAEDKAEIPIVGSESRDRRFWARQPETPDIREANPGGVCVIGRKTTTDHGYGQIRGWKQRSLHTYSRDHGCRARAPK